MTCSNCNSECNSQKTIIIRGQVLDGCSLCLDDQVQQVSDFAAKHHREDQKKTYRRDLLQPFQKDFPRAYGVDEAKKHGWTNESIRKYS